VTDEQWELREREYHGAIWKLLNEISNLENEIRKLKGEEDDDNTKNIIPIRHYGLDALVDNSGSGGR
jgi:hypothetical protein